MGIREANRRLRRSLSGEGQLPRRKAKTGAPAHFKAWKQQAATERFLRQQKTSALIAVPAFSSAANAERIEIIAKAYPNWLALLQADRADLLGLSGIGAATLKRLQHYFMAKDVTPAWAEQ